MESIILTIKPKDTRNEMHFEVQRRNRMQIFRDKTKYSRKIKYKKSYLD